MQLATVAAKIPDSTKSRREYDSHWLVPVKSAMDDLDDRNLCNYASNGYPIYDGRLKTEVQATGHEEKLKHQERDRQRAAVACRSARCMHCSQKCSGATRSPRLLTEPQGSIWSLVSCCRDSCSGDRRTPQKTERIERTSSPANTV